MNLGQKLADNRIKLKRLEWTRKLTGRAKEANIFFYNALEQIKSDIEAGHCIGPICVPADLYYEKSMNFTLDNNFWMVINYFSEDLEKEGLRAIIKKMPENDINRYGSYDHYIYVNPIL